MYNIPNSPTPNVPLKFFNGISLLSVAKQQAFGRLYGIGIAYAEANQRALLNHDFPELEQPSSYTPDAEEHNGIFLKSARWDGRMSSSLSGIPVLCALEFIGGIYTDMAGVQQTIPDVVFETVVISASLDKIIEKTSISGRDQGTIKESIGMNDWRVDIRAIITADAPVSPNIQKVNQDGVYPRDNIASIMKLVNAPIALPIRCWWLEQLGIQYLCVENMNIEQVEGEYSAQRIVISTVSDKPLVIKIANA